MRPAEQSSRHPGLPAGTCDDGRQFYKISVINVYVMDEDNARLERFACLWNPNGILSYSPGLRQRRYPGDIPNPNTQPQRGYVIPTQTARPISCRVCGETPCIRPEMFVFYDAPADWRCIQTFCLWLMR